MALTDNIYAYYKLDESSGNALDATGNGHTLTNGGVTCNVTAVINTGFSGAGGGGKWIQGAYKTSNVGSSISVSFWVKYTDSNTQYVLQTDSGGYGFGIGLQSNTVHVYCGKDWNTGVSVSNGTWTFIVVTFSGGNVSVYKNNAAAVTNGSNTIPDGNNWTFENHSSSGQNYYLNGTLDEIGVWSRAISSGEVTSLYNSGSGLQYPFAINYTATPSVLSLTSSQPALAQNLDKFPSAISLASSQNTPTEKLDFFPSPLALTSSQNTPSQNNDFFPNPQPLGLSLLNAGVTHPATDRGYPMSSMVLRTKYPNQQGLSGSIGTTIGNSQQGRDTKLEAQTEDFTDVTHQPFSSQGINTG